MDDGPAIIERLTRFGHELRDEGLSIGSGDIVTYCEALARLDPGDLEDLYWSGRATLVTRRDQLPVYDRTFRRFFLLEPEHSTETPVPPAATQSPEMRAVLEVPDAEPGIGEHEEGEESTLGLMASDAELWRKKAFSACTPDELAAVRRIMARVRLVPPTRRTRRQRASRGRGRIDMRRMARETLRAHGDPARLRWTDRTQRVRPLVLMLDVSGSMSDYSRNLLQFAYSARRAAGRVEVFCFGTRLTRITPALDRRRPDDALERAAARVNDWDGGTRIGAWIMSTTT